MTIFAVLAKEDSKIASTLGRVYPEDHIHVWSGVWFVSDEATTQQVAEKLGVTDGKSGSAVICSVGNYWGRAQSEIWEWLALKKQ